MEKYDPTIEDSYRKVSVTRLSHPDDSFPQSLD